MTYSDVQGDQAAAYVEPDCTLEWGVSNFDTDPCFIDMGYWDSNGTPVDANDDIWFEGDYHLLSNSPCIDSGDPNYVLGNEDVDIDGHVRVVGSRLDMGADEFYYVGDFDLRGSVNLLDFAILASAWLTISGDTEWNAACDISIPPDDLINVFDASVFMENWLEDLYIPQLPGQASNPNPPDSATDVNSTTILIWTAGSYAIWHDVYFGTSSTPQFVSNQTSTIFVPGTMAFGTKYYWRIDETNRWGKTTGAVWNFTTGMLPEQASNPNPADGAMNVDANADLSWTASLYATSHDVYFGTSSPPPFIGNQTVATFDPGTMVYDTTYFWRIDEVNKWSKTTGDLWSFTTEGPKPPGMPGCFPADTPVWIDGAQVQFSKVAAGQKVGRLDATDAVSCFEKPVCLKEIESILEYQGTNDYYNIVLETGNRINVVHSHYFLTASDQWVLVQNLKVGSKLQLLKGSISIKTIAKREVPFTGRFYNLKIKGGDRYFVGKDGVAVRGH
jgi:hypothetical protein